ncbi:MAG: hypothetical protein CFE21_09330 [Bacteroidetes bacterium B1(2017)]|nr:MAG: hypothetical protein CFE21_09330 [Bacteroidetes bacterium B1(2017)]
MYPDTLYQDALYFFKGKEIDEKTFNLITDFVKHSQPQSDGFYGTYSFKINPSSIGLITRVPGNYDATAISLWVYDLKKDSITNSIPLSDLFGDAGDAQNNVSTLFFENNQLYALTYLHYSYDHMVEDIYDSTMDHSYQYSLTKINTFNIDTISTDSAFLTRKYTSFLKKMTSY